jgi:hypothetical protein
MPKSSKSAKAERKTYRGAEALEAAQAKVAGVDFQWHFGRVTRLGYYEVGGLKEVTIVWEEGGVTSHHDMSDEQWEIFRLAFLATGRIAILSDETGQGWMYDHRFLEAVR